MSAETEEYEEPSLLPVLPRRLAKFFDEMGELYKVFECAICYESMKNPVISLKCGHNFCSMCVRKYLLYKPQCPSCFVPLHDPELKPNRCLLDAMQVISKLIPKLEALVKEVRPDFKLPIKPQTTSDTKTPIKKKEAPLSSPSLNKSISPSPVCDTSFLPTPSTSTDSITSPVEPSGEPPSASQTTEEKVSCPVCKVFVLQRNVNQHLDKCLAEQKGELKPTVQPKLNRMEPMKQPIYFLLKDNEIKKRLREHGLSTSGARKTLENRLKSYIALWNAQCDLEKPLTKMEIVMRVHRDEKKLQHVKVNKPPPLLDYDCKTDPEEIESKQKAYVEENKDHFSKLIAKAKASKEGKPSTSLEDLSDELESIKSNEEITKTNMTKEISELALTPKRKLSDDQKDLNTSDISTPKRPKQLFDATPKAVYVKTPCPICHDLIAENLIESHVDRCIDKPEPRTSNRYKKGKNTKNSKKKTKNPIEDDEEEELFDFDQDLLNTTPDIIIDDDGDVISSTPIAVDKENRRTTRRRGSQLPNQESDGGSSPLL